MTQLPDPDKKLVQFLRQHRPLPPQGKTAEIEDKVFGKIERNSHRYPKKTWAIPGTLAAGLLLSWGGYYWGSPAWEFGKNDSEELEIFVFNSWKETLNEPLSIPQSDTLETGWLNLASPETDFAAYSQ